MLFHMYVEKKIIFIQRFYKNYLKERNGSIKVNLIYLYNINKILLIQKIWKKYSKIRHSKTSENNSENILKKSIPFKLDNFDINDNTDSNIEIKTEENRNEIIHKEKKKFIKNNTVSNFYNYKNKKYEIKQEINFFLLSKKREEIFTFEFQNKINNPQNKKFNDKNKNQFYKNISFEIISYFSDNKINIFQKQIIKNMFITKEYKINIRNINEKKILLNNNYISKIRLNKNKIINKIILIQKIIKEYINSKSREYIQRPKSNIYFFTKIRKIGNSLDYSSRIKIENFSFKGNYFIVNSNSNKDKFSENEISNSKSEKMSSLIDNYKQKSSINYNNNLFSFENSNSKINNKDSLKTLLLKEKLKNMLKRYFSFIFKSNINLVYKYMRNIKLIILLKKYILNKIHKKVVNILKYQIYNTNNKNKSDEILDEDDLIKIIKRKKIFKNKSPSDFLIINNKKKSDIITSKEYYINDEDGLANYILNYFYNEKKFTNINLNLIKERLSKCNLIYRTQSNIEEYIEDLYKDILENKICSKCFCKFDENCDIDCPCHIKINSKINKQKGGISLYRQKINKIIKDNKRNIKTNKNYDENENYNNIILFNENGCAFRNKNNNSNINRYDTDSIHSKSNSFSEE